jgi:hypothetical protein
MKANIPQLKQKTPVKSKVFWLDEHLYRDQVEHLHFTMRIVEAAAKDADIELVCVYSIEGLLEALLSNVSATVVGAIIDVMIPLSSGVTHLTLLGADTVKISDSTVGRGIVFSLLDSTIRKRLSEKSSPLVALLDKPLLVLSTLELESSDWDLSSDLLHFAHKHAGDPDRAINSWFSLLRNSPLYLEGRSA